MTLRRTVALLTALAAALSVALVLRTRGDSAVPAGAATAPAGSHAKYVFLAAQHSNRCGMPPSALRSMSARTRLQGACCFPMQEASYRAQIAGLAAYHLPEIPRDPYDIPTGLAKRLIGDGQQTRLTGREQATYDRAMRLTDEKGPCCCHCWRWDAFKGMAVDLIAYRHWNERNIARVIDLVEGCGGNVDTTSI